MSDLPERQRDAYDHVCTWHDLYGRGPSHAELGELLGVHRQTASEHVRALIGKGWLERTEAGVVPVERDAR